MKNQPALFSLGFRPFFFIASIFATVAMLAWVLVYYLPLQLKAFDYYPSTIWHAHEMVFGYGMAVVAGFLLTAIKNWTGVQTVNGNKLMLLVMVWVVGRIAPFIFASSSPWLVALLDSLFLPLLALFVALPLIKVGNKRNYFMIVLVLVLAVLNILLHLELLSILNNFSRHVLSLAFYLIIALIIVMAGRVFPMFSQNGLPNRYQVIKYEWVEKLALPSYLVFVLILLFVRMPMLVLISGLITACLHLIRLKGWYNNQVWQVPLVWILHIGYLFLVVGLVLSAIGAYIPSLYFVALHAFSVGTLGIVTIGMMARVSIGHTGRDLSNPPKSLKYIFWMVVSSALIRVFIPLLLPEMYRWVIVVSGSLWVLSFGLFVMIYTTMWIKPRIDTD